jgi:hypothetical protein
MLQTETLCGRSYILGVEYIPWIYLFGVKSSMYCCAGSRYSTEILMHVWIILINYSYSTKNTSPKMFSGTHVKNQ